MRKKWSKEDLAVFNKSEVMQELENQVVSNIQRLDILKKKAASVEQMNEQAAAAANATAATENLTSAVSELNKQMNSAEDDNQDEVASDALMNEVIDDLNALAKAAVLEGNFKLAYRIERTIDDILEEEVACI